MRRFLFPRQPGYVQPYQAAAISFFCLRFSSKKRKIYQYNSYPTPAKGDVIQIPRGTSQLTRINLYADHIRYHAEWRANLFFLLCIAYYDKKRAIQPSHTKIQHGKGFRRLPACHSSILPGLMDFDEKECIAKSSNAIIDRSFLLHWNNMTVLCPDLVNETDYYFEGYYGATSDYRRRLLATLCMVSYGVHSPVDGLKNFFMIMKVAIENELGEIKNTTDNIPKKVINKILQLQKQGTFKHANPRTCRPHKNFIEKVLKKKKYQSWDLAYKRTQQTLLTGGEDQAIAFLGRFRR